MSFSVEELKQFLLDANSASWGGDKAEKVKGKDGSDTITYTKGAWSFHDNWFGGEPYGGRFVVFFDEKPVWMFVYYGFVNKGIAVKEVYSFLMESLRRAPADFPVRGPKEYKRDEWHYENEWQGDLLSFSGTEKIFRDDTGVYEASYLGGLVDQQGDGIDRV